MCLYLYLSTWLTCICICNWLTCIGEVATVLCVALPACNEQQWKSHSLEVGEPRLWAPSAGWCSLNIVYIVLLYMFSLYCAYNGYSGMYGCRYGGGFKGGFEWIWAGKWIYGCRIAGACLNLDMVDDVDVGTSIGYLNI